ncbi:MAG: sodium:alanine symporter family protein [Ruminococcaceae bacterium]|nr:sodium:alanine symporter family protein [Oscillospiraceae bacterium]
MNGLINAINSVIWGAPMLLFFLFVGIYFTFKSRFFQFRGAKKNFDTTIKSLFKKQETTENGISQFGAFCSVLAACIGTGNIVGVATAIYSGGPGSVFWMFISSFFSMMTAYSENYLGIKYRFRNKYGKISGGAFQYIEKGVKMKGLSKVYAVFCLLSTFGMGNMAQANSLSTSLETGFKIPTFLTAVLVAITCFIIIRKGVKGISNLSELLVPVMTISYLVLSFGVLFIFRDRIIPMIILIFKEAFSLKALSGFGIFKAMRYGVSRGVFSNEAGLGSSTIIHSETENTTPETQGIWGMFEVFCDTTLLCTIMALVILVSGSFTPDGQLFGAELSIASYGILGSLGKKGIALLTALFSFASLTSCSFYGEKSAEYLFTMRAIKPYKFIYLILAFLGCIISPQIIWSIADIFNGLMAVPNLFALVILRKEVEFPNKKRNALSHSDKAGKLFH